MQQFLPQAMKVACEKAGLECPRLIHESTAAVYGSMVETKVSLYL